MNNILENNANTALSAPVLVTKNLSKQYGQGTNAVEVFRSIDLAIYPEDTIAIVGSSGSGKSTLLHLLSGLDQPTAGEVWLKDVLLQSCSEKKRGHLRNQYLGFVYQFHHLLAEFSALDNVAMPLLIAKQRVADAREQAAIMLAKVGLTERLLHKPSMLSGGERQRVAIARALVSKPALVLADEPTGNLDQENARAVFELMLQLNQEIGTALIVVTHDLDLASKMRHQWRLKDKQLHL